VRKARFATPEQQYPSSCFMPCSSLFARFVVETLKRLEVIDSGYPHISFAHALPPYGSLGPGMGLNDLFTQWARLQHYPFPSYAAGRPQMGSAAAQGYLGITRIAWLQAFFLVPGIQSGNNDYARY